MKRRPFIISMSLALGILASSLIPGQAFASEVKSQDAQETAAEVTSVNVKETDTENVSAGHNTYDAPELNCVWQYENGNAYWYEHGVRQGTMSDPKGVRWKNDPPSANRGREIYDGSSDAWYWLDSAYGGAKAVSKEVFMPYVYQNEASMSDAEKISNAQASDPGMQDYVLQLMRSGTGKWVRYDENGHMFKGWSTITSANCGNRPDQIGNTYYYDVKTGAMAKGTLTIDGQSYTFNETSGVLESSPQPTNPNDQPVVNPSDPSNPQEQGTEAYYIGNRNSKIFHRPSCSSVRRMKERNKVTFGTRGDAISSGYRPCNICKP